MMSDFDFQASGSQPPEVDVVNINDLVVVSGLVEKLIAGKEVQRDYVLILAHKAVSITARNVNFPAIDSVVAMFDRVMSGEKVELEEQLKIELATFNKALVGFLSQMPHEPSRYGH